MPRLRQRRLGGWGDIEEGGQLRIFGESERHRILFERNDTAAEFPRDKCVHEMFEEQVSCTPNAKAVVFEGASVTYAELNGRANQLAQRLRALGAKPDARVAICLERSPEMVVAILAVLKAGCAYVPFDPEYPVERLKHSGVPRPDDRIEAARPPTFAIGWAVSCPTIWSRIVSFYWNGCR